ncbi:YegJ family protein [Terricaulis sp.]|uniref:YegJ family protein n=1 Tax=Terricaulis sp. TaxID=2768686 RepID=UPI0037844CFA
MMRPVIFFLALSLIATPAFAQKDGGEGPQDRVQYFAPSDQAMNDAIAEAHTTLPQFMALLRRTPEGQRGGLMLKVGLDTPDNGREHIWIDSLRYEGDTLVGNLANVPDALPGLRLGSRVEIEPERISDWMIQSPRGIYGAYTMRVMIQTMSPAEAAQYRALLAPTLLPPDWTS